MNQWFSQNGSSLVHSRGASAFSLGISRVRPESEEDYLIHYGVKGQQWGVITKEYEPVAIDHRKTRGGSTVSTATTPRSGVRMAGRNGTSVNRRTVSQNLSGRERRQMDRMKQEQARREREGYYTRNENGETVWRQNGKSYSPSADRQQIVRRALIGAGIVAGLLATYGAIKYRQVTKAKAYSGILKRYLSQTPGASLDTEAGRKLYQRGLDLAKKNSENMQAAKATNAYLKRKGLSLGTRKAMSTYRQSQKVAKTMHKAAKAANAGKIRTLLRRYGLVSMFKVGGA